MKSETWDAYGILNHLGTPWTPRTFDSAVDALEYLRDWSRFTKIKLPRHKVVSVRVTVRTKKSKTK